MANEPQFHVPVLELAEAMPAEIAVGGDVTLKVRLACGQGCELGGLPLAIEDADGHAQARVPPSNGEIREITLKAPDRVGAQTWTVTFAAHEHAGVRHGGCALVIPFTTRPHSTSLAVWGAPSPAVIGAPFSIKVGAKSSAGATLAGRGVAINDASGATVGRGTLGDAPWPGTSALYWTEVELPAPAQEGLAWYAVNFAATDAETPHDGSASKFSVAVVRPPEHRLSVAVFEKDTRAPIEDAQVRLGAYAAATDPSGRAEVAVPKGSYELTIWKSGYDTPVQTIDIGSDVGIEIEAVVVPPENPYAPWAE